MPIERRGCSAKHSVVMSISRKLVGMMTGRHVRNALPARLCVGAGYSGRRGSLMSTSRERPSSAGPTIPCCSSISMSCEALL